MNQYSLRHLADHALLTNLDGLDARDSETTAELLAHLAEVDERKLFVPAGYPCMRDYCIHGRHYSKDVANKRVRAARAARRFPVIFEMVADGRLHLCGVSVLASRLTPENAEDLLTVASHKTREEIERLLAERYPRPDFPEMLGPVAPGPLDGNGNPGAPAHLDVLVAPGPLESTAPHPRMMPLSADRSAFQCTIPRRVEDKIRYAQTLASHHLPSGDLAALLELFVDAFIEKQEKKKFGATSRPRQGRGSSDPRYIPLEVKRAVRKRDGGRCTFLGTNGHRCTACRHLHFDHITPVARGGASTVDNVRLLCSAHNQHEAERVFGAGFMEMKREAARAAAAERRAAAAEKRARAEAERAEQRARAEAERAEKRARAEAERAAKQAQAEAEKDPDRSVVPWLRSLGATLDNARRADAYCQSLTNLPDLTLEEKIKAALRFLGPPKGRAA